MLVGRGGTRGKTSGRGTKGQKARSGHKIRPELRDFIKKIPRLRGRGKNSNLTIQDKNVVVHLGTLQKSFKGGEVITRELLIEKGIINRSNGKIPAVKILSDGEFSIKLSFKGLPISKTAKEKIEKAGGEILLK